jgi:3-hydroxyacyl-[acyl-carrier-protein] dehydratase
MAEVNLGAAEIMRIIPHRTPFLLVDRIIELEEGKRAVGLKAVTSTEPHLAGHFPGVPIMPGVLIVEALAQVGAVAVLSMEEHRGKLAVFAGIDKVRFKRMVRPGDVLRLEVTMTKARGPVGVGEAVATVDGDLACRGELMFAFTDWPDGTAPNSNL